MFAVDPIKTRLIELRRQRLIDQSGLHYQPGAGPRSSDRFFFGFRSSGHVRHRLDPLVLARPVRLQGRLYFCSARLELRLPFVNVVGQWLVFFGGHLQTVNAARSQA